MITNIVTTSNLYEIEPSLADFLRQSQSDYSTMITSAFRMVLLDLRNKGFDLRLLNTPLSLHASGEETSAVTGTQSSIDYINRNLLTIHVTAISSTETFQLYGTNESSPSSSDWTAVGDVTSITSTGYTNVILTSYYQYYRLDKTSATTCTYTAYLSENIYYYMILYKALVIVYNSIRRLPNRTTFEDKSIEYQDMYNDLLTNGLFSYDSNADGKIDNVDMQQDFRTIRVTL